MIIRAAIEPTMLVVDIELIDGFYLVVDSYAKFNGHHTSVTYNDLALTMNYSLSISSISFDTTSGEHGAAIIVVDGNRHVFTPHQHLIPDGLPIIPKSDSIPDNKIELKFFTAGKRMIRVGSLYF